jgi:excisionase family DNA binding protein
MSQKKPNAPPDDAEQYYTVAEVAKKYRVTSRTVRNWMKWSWLKHLKLGRLIRIPESALVTFDKNH